MIQPTSTQRRTQSPERRRINGLESSVGASRAEFPDDDHYRHFTEALNSHTGTPETVSFHIKSKLGTKGQQEY
jgi:hypothetical protein